MCRTQECNYFIKTGGGTIVAKTVKILGNFYNKFEEYLLCASLLITVTVIFMQIIMRFIFHNAFTWSEELTRYIFVGQIWLGTSIAVREGVHIRVEAIFKLVKGKMVYLIEIVSNLIWALFCLFIVISAIGWIATALKTNTLSPAMRIPLGYIYMSIPFGCAAMGIRLLPNIYKNLRLLIGLDQPEPMENADLQISEIEDIPGGCDK